MKSLDVFFNCREQVIEEWVNAIFNTYPLQSTGFLRTVKDPFTNPVADMVTISGIEGNGRAVLYDMRGSIVASFAVNGTETRLDLGRLTAGIYMLRVDDSVVKIIKE